VSCTLYFVFLVNVRSFLVFLGGRRRSWSVRWRLGLRLWLSDKFSLMFAWFDFNSLGARRSRSDLSFALCFLSCNWLRLWRSSCLLPPNVATLVRVLFCFVSYQWCRLYLLANVAVQESDCVRVRSVFRIWARMKWTWIRLLRKMCVPLW